MGYLIDPNKQIVTAKVTLTSANLLTPGYIYNIPEYAAVKGYFWNVLYMNGEITNGFTPYAGTSFIHIQADGTTSAQYRFTGVYMQGLPGVWSHASPTGGAGASFLQFKQLQIHNPGTLTGGDTELVIYIGANLIKY